jgi:hypothetical protein
MKITALFETTLAASISATATSATLTYGKDKLGNDLSGEYGFIIDEGTNKEEFIIADVSGTALTDMQRGISPSDGRTEVSALKFAHRKGASVKITDFPILGLLTDYLTGVIPLPAVPKLDPSRVISDPNHIIDKAYGDAIGVAGITGFLVQNGTGKQVNINAGTYIKNGEILTYAGASGVAVSTGNNYIEFKDGAISINQTGFTNDSYSLALVVCNASTITSNTDKRSFINITDLRANTNGTLLTGAVIAGMRVYTGWTGITNGSFRATIDGIAYNFDAINFSTATSMNDVATLIQTKIRAITGGSETVSYNATDYKFTITSGTTGTESQVSVLSTSTGTVGTDISGANYLNGAAGTATQGTGNFIDRDSLGLFAKIGQGLKIVGGYLLPKLKTAGGLLNGTDGMYVDSGTFALKNDVSQQVRKAGENITALNYLCEVETNESYTTGTDARNFADTTSSQRVRQSFKLPINTILKRIKINGLKMVGTPTTDLVIGIYDTDGATLLGSYTLPYQTLTTSYQDFDIPFATNISITANTTYWIDIRRSDDSYNGSNYYAWQSNASGGYANGKTQLYNSGTTTWADDSTRDCRFYAYYDVVMKADDGNNPSLGYTPIGFAYDSVSKDADVKVITDGILDGFNFARYDVGTLTTFWNFTIDSAEHALYYGGSYLGRSVTSYYYMENIEFIRQIDLKIAKYGTGLNMSVELKKMDLSGTYQTIWTKSYLASELSTGVLTMYPNIHVGGGGAYCIVVSGSNSTAGNYISVKYRSSGVYTNYLKLSDSTTVNAQDNLYCVIKGYKTLYKEDCPVYLQNSGAISPTPEGTYSYQVGRVIDKTKIVVNPKYEGKFLGSYSPAIIEGASSSWGQYLYFTIPQNATRVIIKVNASGPYQSRVDMELNKVDAKSKSFTLFVGSSPTTQTLSALIGRDYGYAIFPIYAYAESVDISFYK